MSRPGSWRWTIPYIPLRLWNRIRHGVNMSWSEVFAMRVWIPDYTDSDRQRMRTLVANELERRRASNLMPEALAQKDPTNG